MREYYITKNDSGQRLNKFLEKAVPLLSGGMMHKYLRLKRIKVNNKRTEAAYKLAEGDSVQLYLNDEYFDAPKEEEAFRRIKTPRVRVVYEDEHILLADKAPGMVLFTQMRATATQIRSSRTHSGVPASVRCVESG